MAEQKSILQKYVDVVTDISNPVKDTKGYGYMYAKIDQVLGIIQKACKAHKCAVMQKSIYRRADEFNPAAWVLITSFTDGNDFIELDVRELVNDKNAQIKGSYETYMRRYALVTAFGMAAEDDDGRRTTDKITDAQIKTLQNLCDDFKVGYESVIKKYNHTTFDEITTKEYDRLIEIFRRKGAEI